MRVLHVIQSLGRGGAERVALQLSEGMMDAGWSCEIVALAPVDEFPEYASVQRSFLLSAEDYRWPACLPVAARRLRRVIKLLNPDCIEIHSPGAALAYAWSGCRTPAVQVLHGHDSAWGAGGLEIGHRLSLTCRRWASAKMRAHIAVSRGLARAAHLALHIPPTKLTSIPNGVDVMSFNCEPRDLNKPLVVVVVGRLVHGKRPELALRALESLLKMRQAVELLYVGDGPLRSRLENEAQRLHLARHVRFLGVQKDIAAILASAHLLWQFSDSEGLPIVCLEAMASGLPSIVSAVTGNSEAIEDGVTGWLIANHDPASAATISHELMKAPDLYKQMADAARLRAGLQFDLSRMIQRHISVVAAAVA